MDNIDWKKFEGKYVKLEADKKKLLIVAAWRMGESKYENEPAKPALVFDVLSEDGVPVSKEFKASAFALVQKLKPLVESADIAGKGELNVAITKVGKGPSTNYVVETY